MSLQTRKAWAPLTTANKTLATTRDVLINKKSKKGNKKRKKDFVWEFIFETYPVSISFQEIDKIK